MYQLYGCSMLGTAAPGALVSHWQIAAHGMEEEEDRGKRVAQRENCMIKEAETEKKMGNSRYQRQLNC